MLSKIDEEGLKMSFLKNKRSIVVIIVLILALLGGGFIAYYYYYESLNYVTTDNAQVTADMVTITPEITGRLVEWNVEEGDTVDSGQIIGRQSLDSTLTSSSTDPQSLSSTAGVMASKLEIKSPIKGEVIQSNAVVGQLVSPGSSLAVIADTDDAYIKANIKETEIRKVKIGQKVDVDIDAYPGKTFNGTVASIGYATNSVFSLLPSQNTGENYIKVTQVIPVKIVLTDGQKIKLMPGMNVTVKLHVR